MISSIRSAIFYILISAFAVVIPIIYFFPVFVFNSSKWADHGAKIWSKFIIWTLNKICSIEYELRGLENLPKDQGFIIASKHQSMWETIVMHIVIPRPVYAYKKELLKVPFYGWFLARMSGVTIDRKGGAKALKSLLSDSKKYLDKNRAIVIFPQGTRTPIGATVEEYPYQPGITALYSKLKVPVIPAALNSGICWGKKGCHKPGKIILEFLPAINPGLDKKEFLPLLEKVIESKSNQLI